MRARKLLFECGCEFDKGTMEELASVLSLEGLLHFGCWSLMCTSYFISSDRSLNYIDLFPALNRFYSPYSIHSRDIRNNVVVLET